MIVGGGISGLIAAVELEKKGNTTTVLEASSRFGGRCVRQKTIQNWWVDLGGQWMGKTHHLFKDLAKEPDIKTFDSFYDGETVFIWNGKRITAPMDSDWASSFIYVPFDRVPVAEEDRKAARQLHQEFLELTKSVDNERPWQSPQARELDTQTIETWLNSRTNSELTHYIFKWYTRVGGSGGFEPGESSMLHLAQTQKACP